MTGKNKDIRIYNPHNQTIMDGTMIFYHDTCDKYYPSGQNCACITTKKLKTNAQDEKNCNSCTLKDCHGCDKEINFELSELKNQIRKDDVVKKVMEKKIKDIAKLARLIRCAHKEIAIEILKICEK